MAQRIDADQVRYVAALARLSLTDAEVDSMTADLASILGYVRKLAELDTEGVQPTTHAVDLPTQYREDQVEPGLPAEVGLRGAPERIGDGFGVPKIIE